MRRKTTNIAALFLGFSLVIAQFAFLPNQAFAAPQQTALGGTNSSEELIFDTDDDPRLNDDPATTITFGGVSIVHGTEGSPERTTSDSNLNQIYTWRLPSLADHVCTSAQLTSLRVVADVTADTEGDPDLSALMVYRIDGSDQYNIGDYTIQQGTDYATSTGGFTPPNNDGIYGVVRGSAPVFGSQLTGQLEATWDLSSYNPSDQFGIMVQQDSQDGSINLQTTIQTVELTYDDENCVIDGAITKTLLNPGSVTPGGQAVFEITVTNNGTEPIPFNGAEDRGIYDVVSPSLSFQGVESNDVDVECEDYGTLNDAFGSEPGATLPYQNHLDYHILLCASQSSAVLPVGETWSFQMTFDVAINATNITNFVSWPLVFESVVDPGLLPFIQAMGSLEPGGPDLIDLTLSGELVSDNVALVSYDFPNSNNSTSGGEDTLASSGSSILWLSMPLGAIVVLAGALLRKKASYNLR